MIRFDFRLAAAACCLAGLATLAHGAQRTFVATSGSDANACSLAAPCRSFATAIAATDAGGEVIVLDSGGYGATTINKSVSLIAPPGVYAGISVFSGSDGIVIDAAATDVVTLRGLSINGQGGFAGIRVSSVNHLFIEDCTVSKVAVGLRIDGGIAIYVSRTRIEGTVASHGIQMFSGTPLVFVADSRISGNHGRGVSVEAGEITLDRVSVENNFATGVRLEPSSTTLVAATIRDSVVAENNFGIFTVTDFSESVRIVVERTTVVKNRSTGVFASVSGSGTATVTVHDSVIADNVGDGVLIGGGATSTAFVSANTIVRNSSFGLSQNGASVLRAFGNNVVSGNNGGGAQTAGVITNDSLM